MAPPKNSSFFLCMPAKDTNIYMNFIHFIPNHHLGLRLPMAGFGVGIFWRRRRGGTSRTRSLEEKKQAGDKNPNDAHPKLDSSKKVWNNIMSYFLSEGNVQFGNPLSYILDWPAFKSMIFFWGGQGTQMEMAFFAPFFFFKDPLRTMRSLHINQKCIKNWMGPYQRTPKLRSSY